jgi:superfamily II DNA or RNA helicase
MDKYLLESNSWDDLKIIFGQFQTTKEKGELFERLTELYLKLHPSYTTKLKNVWRWSNLPEKIRTSLNLPRKDLGVDIVAQTVEGNLWAIQCKYIGDYNHSVTLDYISTFASILATRPLFTFGLVATTADRFSNHITTVHGDSMGFLAGDIWRGLDAEFFSPIKSYLGNKEQVILVPKEPRPHQQRAIDKAKIYFNDADVKPSRGKLIMPCGTGKSMTGFWIAKKLKAKKLLVALPSLSLIRQTLEAYAREALANNLSINWIVVCSDDTVDQDNDDVSVLTQDLGVQIDTDPEAIAQWLQKSHSGLTIVFTTYQSGKITSEASQKANINYDLGIFDEAHKTVGNDNAFSHLLYEENIKIKKRLFMTATERRYQGSSEKIASMDNVELYGEDFEVLTFKEALEYNPPILTDYKLITVVVTNDEINKLIQNNSLVTYDSENQILEVGMVASLIALQKSMMQYGIHHAVSFHSSVRRAKRFQEMNKAIILDHVPMDTYHVSGKTPTAVRSSNINKFAKSNKALITNARCLTEGVDVPGIDAVLFADPKQSTVDIVQAVGRALRVFDGKTFGYIIVPIVVEGDSLDNFESTEAYQSILKIIRALASNDDRIIDYFRSIDKGQQYGGSLSWEFIAKEGVGIDIKEFSNVIQTKLWDKIGKLCWRPFEEAREFSRTLELASGKEWQEYCRGTKKVKGISPKPADIPSSPASIYKNDGWKNMDDWLGSKEWLNYEDARDYVRTLKILPANQKGWMEHWQNNPIPNDIPAQPQQRYQRYLQQQHKRFIWKDFLIGTGNHFREFTVAREFVKKLELQNGSQWNDYAYGRLVDTKGKKPSDIPHDPEARYRNQWKGMLYWIGLTEIEGWLPYEEAVELVRAKMIELGLEGQKGWNKLRASDDLPDGIPTDPERVYGNECDITYWRNSDRTRKPPEYTIVAKESFVEAKRLVHNLDNKPEPTQNSWISYHKKNCQYFVDNGIVQRPDLKYVAEWVSWEDWVGVESNKAKMMTFFEAKEVIRNKRFKSERECQEWIKKEDIKNFPTSLTQQYKSDPEWKGVADFLGKV